MQKLTSARIVKTVVIAVIFTMAALSLSAGAKDNSVSKTELKSLIINAHTKADHERIARYFDAEAARYDAEAKDHTEMAGYYQKSPDPASSKHPGSSRSVAHCDSLSKNLQQSAEDARQLAAGHREMGKEEK